MPELDSPRPRRVIGRILSLGFPLPGPQVDNHTFLSAPSFFDYDAVVVDPHALSLLIEGVIDGSVEATTFAGEPIANAPTTPRSVALGEVLLRRREETRALLDRGGVVVSFAHPSTAHAAIAGLAAALDDYCWLPAPPLLVAGEGLTAHVVDFQHPLASFVHSQLAQIDYRAHFPAGLVPHACVFARSEGGAAIGVEIPAECGRIVFLPAMKTLPSGDARYTASDAMQAGIRNALGVMAQGRPPGWLGSHPLAGLDERAAAVETARTTRDEAERALDAAEAAYDELARYQLLLWQEGALGLNDVTLDALRLIGFDVYATDPRELELRAEGASVLFEIEGSEHPVDLAAHHRLRQRIERAIERSAQAPRGVLFVNGQRLESPTRRTRPVTDALRVASETMRYCIAPTSSLYAAVAARLSGDDAAVAEYKRRLITTDGVLL
jgi:hypothetical protein